jgi:hypothetical protein
MIALGVIVRHEMVERVPKRGLPEEDHAAQALFFYGAHEPHCERVQIGRSGRQPHDLEARPQENALECLRVLRIPIEYREWYPISSPIRDHGTSGTLPSLQYADRYHYQ